MEKIFKILKMTLFKIIEVDGLSKMASKKFDSNLSVIIRTKNEERWIGYAIQSVLDHLMKPEIVIVDNNSTDKTIDIVKFFAENPNAKPTR